MNDLEKLVEEAQSALNRVAAQQQREAQFTIESQARFQTNLTALETFFPDVAKAIKNFTPDSDFKLLVSETGAGNFIPRHASVPLYDHDPITQVRDQVSKKTKKGYYSLTMYGMGELKDDPRLHIQFMNKLSILFSGIHQQKLKPLTSLPPHFPSAIIFGVGLGYHIPVLLEQHQFDYLFICEPDLEVFYASLFCIDWATIIEKIDRDGNTLFLQVGVSYQEFFGFLYKVANDIGAFSLVRSFCYQHYPSQQINELIQEFFNRYFELQLGFGFYNDAITGLAHTALNLQKNLPLFISTSGKKDYQKYPVYVVGNGPSLDASEELLKATADKAIIIAAGTALASLLKMGITPDFHVLVERTKTTYDVLVDILPLETYKKLNLLTVDVMYPEVADLYQWTGMGLKGPESGTVFIQWKILDKYRQMMPSLPYCGPMVSNTALSYAVQLGFEEIYLIGVDNGAMEASTHSKHSIYNDPKMQYKTPLTKGAKHKLVGNLGVDVMSTDLLAVSKNMMEQLIASAKGRYFYNVGHGAKLEGAYPLVEDDVLVSKTISNKPAVIEAIKKDFFRSGLLTFSEDELAFDVFDEICDYLLEIARTPYHDRQSAAEILKRQSRYLYAYKKTKHAHLFYMIKGSLLYYHCPMITLLYSYDDDAKTLELFAQALALWNEYVIAIKDDFRINYLAKCDMGLKR